MMVLGVVVGASVANPGWDGRCVSSTIRQDRGQMVQRRGITVPTHSTIREDHPQWCNAGIESDAVIPTHSTIGEPGWQSYRTHLSMVLCVLRGSWSVVPGCGVGAPS